VTSRHEKTFSKRGAVLEELTDREVEGLSEVRAPDDAARKEKQGIFSEGADCGLKFPV
jgi:hypothetical protein